MVMPTIVPIAKNARARDRACHPAAQDGERDEGLARSQQSHRKQQPQHGRAADQRPDLPGHPAIVRAAPIERQQQGDRGGNHQRQAGNVELVRPVVARQPAKRTPGHHQGDRSQRQVDPEDKRPMQMIGQKAAEHRTENARAQEDHRCIALRYRALARRQQIGNDRLRDRNETAATDALQGAANDQNPHARCERARERAENENADGQQHDGAPAVYIGELAEQRRRRRRGQKIRRDDPRQVVDIFQAPADGGQCRRDDCLLERGYEHRHHDAGDDGVNGGMIERRQSGGVLRPACEGRRSER